MKPPAGLIRVAGKEVARRHGLVQQRRLTCIFGHRIKLHGRLFENAEPCGAQEPVGRENQKFNDVRCPAHLYIINMRAGLLWAMDVTRDEAELIDRESMDIQRIGEYFGIGFPAPTRKTRSQLP